MTSTRTAAPRPDALGVLNHYDAVVWYTGNDTVTREPGWGPGNASRLAMQEILELRDFVNAGGRVLYTGRAAGQQYTPALGAQLYDPFENKQCSADPAVQARCLALLGSGNSQGDPIEYMLGAAITSAGGGLDPDTGEPFEVDGFDDGPFDGPVVGVQRRRQRAEPDHELVVHRDRGLPEGHRSGGELPAVREPAGRRVPERARRPVRPAHGLVVHVVAARRRGVQAAVADDHRAGRRRDAVVLDELQPRAGLRLPGGRGPHRRAGRLDDAAGRQRPHVGRPQHRRVLHRAAGAIRTMPRTCCTRS